MSTTPNADIAAMKMIQESGILNTKMTLEDVLKLTDKISGLSGGAAGENAVQAHLAATFIYKQFIYKD